MRTSRGHLLGVGPGRGRLGHPVASGGCEAMSSGKPLETQGATELRAQSFRWFESRLLIYQLDFFGRVT